LGWDRTYFIALQTELKQKNIVIIEGAKNSIIPVQEIENKISNYNNGIILIKKNSAFSTNLNLETYNLTTDEIFNNEELVLLSWEK